ncbi:MAG: sialidase family protein [Spirochaetaceae bacterium]|nr:sialidase family protein [Spirochaetaceae bacterium]
MILHLDGSRTWSCAGGEWRAGDDGRMAPVDAFDANTERGMQGCRFAFATDTSYRDFRATFQACHDVAHSDIGLIFRARNRCDFTLLHFPCCGQGYRAQHFWTALSRMDASGCLRVDQLAMVNRVASSTRIWHDVEVEVRGGELRARIDGRGVFEHRGLPDGAGCVGLFVFGRARVRDVRIDGEPAPGAGWDDSVEQPANWFYPVEDAAHGVWQKPQTLLRAGDGELALTYNASRPGPAGTTNHLMTRSADDGRTWSAPEVTGTVDDDPWTVRGTLHRFPDGRVRQLSMNQDGAFALADVSDDIRTIGSTRPLDLGPVPDGMAGLHMGPQVFANLADGTVVMFLYGGHQSGPGHDLIHTWGACHCRAYTCRSTDNGATWSPLVNIDHAVNGKGEPVPGSLDLTEVCGAETAGGTMVALIRPVYSPWMWETWSDDGGLTWTPCMRGPFPGYATPNMLRTSSGVLLVAHRLPMMTVHASFDAGASWQGTIIDSSIWVMGSMLEVRPDLVLYVYYDSFESRMRAQYLSVADGTLTPVRRDQID